MFRRFGIISLITFIIMTSSSCLIRLWSEPEYPDDGLTEEERATITLTLDLNGGKTSTQLVNGNLLIGKYAGLIHLSNPTKDGYIFTGWSPSMPQRFPESDGFYRATFNRTREYSITYYTGSGTVNSSNPVSYNIESPAITLQPASRQGYSFEGWYSDSYYRNRITYIPQGSTGNISVYAKWTPGMSAYRIEHWLQNANDSGYTIASKYTQTVTALSDSTTAAAARQISGYTALNINQQKVAGDRSTVVKIYYNRNMVELYLNLDGGSGTTILRGRPGETVVPPADPVKNGYTFNGWVPSLPKTFSANASFTATWKIYSDPVYKVEHWQQNLNGSGYTLFSTTTEKIVNSKTGRATASVQNFPGFTVKSIDQTKTSSDGNAVIKIYYDRNTIELTLDLDGGSGTTILRGKYGARINSIPKPVKAGSAFITWNPALPDTFPAQNATFRAVWNTQTQPSVQNTPSTARYSVEHWQQNVNGSGYTILSNYTETKSGSAGSNTTAASLNFPGFTPQGISQLRIASDGSTVVKIYYDRNIVEILLDNAGGSGTTVLRGRYGARVTAPNNPTKAGCTFAGWSPSIPSTFPEYSITCTAVWNASSAKYRIEHWQQNADDSGYTLFQSETKSGKAGSETSASAKSFTGFYTQGGVSQTIIEADGSTVVQIYYNRNAVDMHFELDGGTGITHLKGVYGARVTAPNNPTKAGCTFAGWSPSIPSTFPAETTIYKAMWNSEECELKLNLDSGTGTTSIKGSFGAPVIPPPDPVKEGYRFTGWKPELPKTFPAGKTNYKAQWEKIE